MKYVFRNHFSLSLSAVVQIIQESQSASKLGLSAVVQFQWVIDGQISSF